MALSWEVLICAAFMLCSCNSCQGKSEPFLKWVWDLLSALFKYSSPYTRVTQHSAFLLCLLCFLFSMVVSPWTGVGGFKLFSWRFFYSGLFLDVYAGVSLTATVFQAELCVHAVGLGTCWTPWVPGGVLCKEQSQMTAAAAQRGPRPARSVCWDLGVF